MVPFYSKAYLNTQVNTAGRLDLVLALYEKAIAEVNQAMKAIREENDATRSNSIHAAAEILMALSEALDYTEPGGLAGRLFALYHYQLRLLLEANRTKDVESLQTVKSTLSILLNGWQQASRSTEAAEIRRSDVKNSQTNPGALRAGHAAARASFGMLA